MVIGQFCDTYPPQVDGVGRVTYSYCETLTRMGHEAYYIAPKSPGVPAQPFPVVLSASMAFPGELFRVGLPALDSQYRRALDDIPFDIVHAHDPFIAASEARRVAKKRDIPLVSTFHSKYYEDLLAKTHSETISKMLLKRIVHVYEECDAVWTVNNATANVLREYGYLGDILVMENGTNPETIQAEAEARILRRAQLRPGALVLFFVGQHNWKKNLHGVLGACALLRDAGVDFQLVTAGDGPDFDAIVTEAVRLGIADRVTFLRWITDRAELMAMYAHADLFLFPSLYDTFGLVVREAAVMGTPSVLVAGSCAAEGIIDGYNGFIAPAEDAGSIARTIQRAIPTRRDVGRMAQKTLPLTWDSIMLKVIREYQKLIDGV